MTTEPTRIRCSGLKYRQGFVEVSAFIHANKINIETWQLDPGAEIEHCDWVDDATITDSDISANCEIEMSIEDARKLAVSILSMIGERS